MLKEPYRSIHPLFRIFLHISLSLSLFSSIPIRINEALFCSSRVFSNDVTQSINYIHTNKHKYINLLRLQLGHGLLLSLSLSLDRQIHFLTHFLIHGVKFDCASLSLSLCICICICVYNVINGVLEELLYFIPSCELILIFPGILIYFSFGNSGLACFSLGWRIPNSNTFIHHSPFNIHLVHFFSHLFLDMTCQIWMYIHITHYTSLVHRRPPFVYIFCVSSRNSV